MFKDTFKSLASALIVECKVYEYFWKSIGHKSIFVVQKYKPLIISMKKTRDYGGRKSLPENNKKSEVIKVRLTPKQIAKIKDLHEKSDETNLSELIREILFKKPITVNVKSVDVSNIQTQLDKIKNSWNTFVKQENSIEVKDLIKDIKIDITTIKEKVNSLKKGELILDDLKEVNRGAYWIYWD